MGLVHLLLDIGPNLAHRVQHLLKHLALQVLQHLNSFSKLKLELRAVEPPIGESPRLQVYAGICEFADLLLKFYFYRGNDLRAQIHVQKRYLADLVYLVPVRPFHGVSVLKPEKVNKAVNHNRYELVDLIANPVELLFALDLVLKRCN